MTDKIPKKPTMDLTYCPLCQSTIAGETPEEHMKHHVTQSKMKTTWQPMKTEGHIHIATPMDVRPIEDMPEECKNCPHWIGCPYKYFSKGHCTRVRG